MIMRGVSGCAKCPLGVMRSRCQESELLAASSTWLSSLQETGGGKESAPQAAPTSGGGMPRRLVHGNREGTAWQSEALTSMGQGVLRLEEVGSQVATANKKVLSF